MNSLFGIEWTNQSFDGATGVIHKLDNDKFGSLFVTEFAMDDLVGLDDRLYPLILSVLRENFLNGKSVLIYQKNKQAYLNFRNGKVKLYTIQEVVDEFPGTMEEKQIKIVLNLAKLQPDYGKYITEIDLYDCFSKDNFEMAYFLNILQEKELIDSGFSVSTNGRPAMKNGILLKEKAWITIEEMQKRHNFKQAFVAMWFDGQMDDAYLAIEEACKQNGFKAFRINSKEHNNEISGEILYEIKYNSKFVIADVTGQRQGVYFEAGYAMALGLQVIWCCREDELSKVHFDTRQYNHVVWKDSADLKEKLNSRIKGTIQNS